MRKKEEFLLAEELIDVDINKEEVEKSVEVLIKTLNPECLSLLKESTKRSQEVVEKNQKTAYFSWGTQESNHKIEDSNQDTVESNHENIHWNQDIDACAQSKIYGLNLKDDLDLKLELVLEHLKVQFA